MKNKLLIIVWPTALGKTDLGLILAKKFNVELIACDSRQIYRGLKIGTGKGDEKIRLYDVADPKKQYSVAEYVKDAHQAIEEVLDQGKLPIIVGGTGPYLRGLLGGIYTMSTPPDEKLRGELEKLYLEDLQDRVAAFSPTSFSGMNNSDRKNKRRLIRKIELLYMNPYIVNKQNKNSRPTTKYDILKVGLTAPRAVINSRIDQRVLLRLEQGMVNEAKSLYEEGLSFKRMKELGLEYGV
jgi:tRNA dimethylallyltransferase